MGGLGRGIRANYLGENHSVVTRNNVETILKAQSYWKTTNENKVRIGKVMRRVGEKGIFARREHDVAV
jgi:hypothetical protein